VGGCLYLGTSVGEAGEILQCVQKEARATFREGLVGLCFLSGEVVKGIKQVSVTSKTSQGIRNLLPSSPETRAEEMW